MKKCLCSPVRWTNKIAAALIENNKTAGQYVGGSLTHHYDFIKSFVEEYGDLFASDDDPNVIDDAKLQNLLIYTSNYTMSIATKKTAQDFGKIKPSEKNGESDHKTVQDLIVRNKKRLEKVLDDFDRLQLYTKGTHLKEAIMGFLENSNGYIVEKLEFKANNTELRSFLKSIGLLQNAIKEYLDHFNPRKQA